ncbi:MAG: DUF418 domain-containing protein [Acidobacteria bacterium]|nr:DUF418 domain-containing protein [Acidobacteriota bacterium]
MPEQFSTPSTSAEPTPATGPVRPKERIEILDILRGFALFGVLLANMSDALPWSFLFAELWRGTADQVALRLIEFFVTGKFLRLFSFLFGLGFALQLGRAESLGARFVPLYVRRLAVLLLIGLAHFLVGWTDILHAYAVLAVLLLLLRTCRPRTLLIVAFACLLIGPAYDAVVTGVHELRRADPQTAQQVIREDAQRAAEMKAWNEQALRVHSRGSFREITAHNARDLARYLSSHYPLTWWLGGIFPVFLLGLYAGRRRILENIPEHLPFIRNVLWWGLGLGLLGMSANLVVTHLLANPAWPFLTHQLAGLLWTVGAPALCLSYAAAITLLVQREGWKKRLAPLAAVGRLALSNYLFQTLMAVLIFYSYGFGLWGKVGPLGGAVMALLIFPFQILLSLWWLRHFRFGPAEWLWRSLTYGKLQPMRVAAREA